MTGPDVAAATYLFTWARRHRENADNQVGDEAEKAFRTALTELHTLVVGKLGVGDRRLDRLVREAGAHNQPTDKTLADVASDLRTESEEDSDFATRLQALLQELRRLERTTDPISGATTGTGGLTRGLGWYDRSDTGDGPGPTPPGTIDRTAPRPVTPWPHQIGTVPPRAASFRLRDHVQRLRDAVRGGYTAALTQVLTGTGGVGKTQLAADYTRTEQEGGAVDVVVWVTAATRTAIISAYAQAAAELCGAALPDAEQDAAVFLAHLTPRHDGPRWLIVLDDVTQPADLTDLWPPANPRGRTIVTTRRRDDAFTGPEYHRIPIGVFTPGDSLAYLTGALTARARHEPVDQLAVLAEDLGHLPLALSQSVSYLVDADLGIADYRARLTDRRTRLPESLPEADSLPDRQCSAVAAAWNLSIDRVNTMRPVGLARPLLGLLAQLDPNGIPHAVLTTSPVLTHLAENRQPYGGPKEEVTQREVVGILRMLHRLSLIDRNPTAPHQAVRISRFLQHALRAPLPPRQQAILARTAADALAAAWPRIENDATLAQALRANTTALTEHALDALFTPDTHPVLFHAGNSLGEAGQVAAARDYFTRLKTHALHHLGPDHPDTLAARGNLAHWRGHAGDPAGAAAAYAELLPHLERVLGAHHPDTLTARSNRTCWRGEAGDPADAANALAELLTDRLHHLGPDHPDTLLTRGNLAYWRGQAGDPAGAAAAYAELLPHLERVLGAHHPDTLTARSNLAAWHGQAGDPAGAAHALAELLTERLRILGPDHPHTLTTRHNLAYWRGQAGDPAGATHTFAELLTDYLRVLGPDHPDTLLTRGNLARWRGQAGDPAGAAHALAQLLTDYLRVLGPDHPDTPDTPTAPAHGRGQAGDPAGAANAYAELLPHLERVLGPDHPDTLTTRGNLARWRGQAGDPAGAAHALAQLLTDCLRILGPDHPHTLHVRQALARWRGETEAGASRFIGDGVAEVGH